MQLSCYQFKIQCFNFKVTAMMTTKKISTEHTQKEMRRVSKSVSTHPHIYIINETQRKTVEKTRGTKAVKDTENNKVEIILPIQ